MRMLLPQARTHAPLRHGGPRSELSPSSFVSNKDAVDEQVHVDLVLDYKPISISATNLCRSFYLLSVFHPTHSLLSETMKPTIALLPLVFLRASGGVVPGTCLSVLNSLSLIRDQRLHIKLIYLSMPLSIRVRWVPMRMRSSYTGSRLEHHARNAVHQCTMVMIRNGISTGIP